MVMVVGGEDEKAVGPGRALCLWGFVFHFHSKTGRCDGRLCGLDSGGGPETGPHFWSVLAGRRPIYAFGIGVRDQPRPFLPLKVRIYCDGGLRCFMCVVNGWMTNKFTFVEGNGNIFRWGAAFYACARDLRTEKWAKLAAFPPPKREIWKRRTGIGEP
jgi:hypothetical protein